MEKSLPLHQTKAHKFALIMNRLFTITHSIAISLLIYYRASFLPLQGTRTLPWLLMFASELLLSFIWLIGQAYHWNPISRTTFADRLPKTQDGFPAIDVFICTADPMKEPTFEVMNTVLSVMALDYPIKKLNIYLSDDAGSEITLQGMREAWRFGKWWLPFCRKYRIKAACPQAYFASFKDDKNFKSFRDNELIKKKYKIFKERIEKIREDWMLKEKSIDSGKDHPPMVEVIKENIENKAEENAIRMPLLVYVAREKRPSRQHHFKAGALNVLLRVSGLMSNSPYVLVLDCDMFCNDISSAKQAMCFHLDSEISPSLSFVQFPQRFNNISKNDIYDSQMRNTYQVLWLGMDGLRGPCISGTNFYIKRKSLYVPSVNKGIDLAEVRSTFGLSNEFIKSLNQDKNPEILNTADSSVGLIRATKFLALCNYEDLTKWGKKVGFLYYSVAEDVFTSFHLHCKGWTSVYLNPSKPQFLGTSTTSLNDVLIQGTRWSSGYFEIALSRFCPLLYGPLKMSLLQSMCYAELALFPLLYTLPLWCFATIPQICLLNGIPLYPQVSSPFFKLYIFVFVSSHSRHLYEVLMTGGSVQTWMNEQRIWMIKSVTCHLFGTLDAVMKNLKLREASFIPTNKVNDDEQIARYQKGVFDFQAPKMMLAPLVALIAVNLVSFFGGIIRMISKGDLDKMFIQTFISAHILVMNYPVLEGMILRKDKGRIKSCISILYFLVVTFVFLILGSFSLIF